MHGLELFVRFYFVFYTNIRLSFDVYNRYTSFRTKCVSLSVVGYEYCIVTKEQSWCMY